MRGRGDSRRLVLLLAVFLTLLAPSGASAATVVNGGFESGDLRGWRVHRTTSSANWFAYKGTDAPISGKNKPLAMQPPPQGVYAAITDEAIRDTLILYQDVALEAGRGHRLSLLAYYDSGAPIAVPTPDTLSVDDGVLGGKLNQQYRIDVMRPGAPIESIDPADILRTLLRTVPSNPVRLPGRLPPTRLTADLSPFAGQTVRLRIAVAAHEETLRAGVDAISISDVGAGGSQGRGRDRLGFGKARANRRNGTVALLVRVPGPGLLTARGRDIPMPAGSAHGSKAQRRRRAVKPVTLKLRGAGTVTIRLKPTPFARSILKRKHKLRVKVTLRYKPANAPAEVASLPLVFKLEAGSSRRMGLMSN